MWNGDAKKDSEVKELMEIATTTHKEHVEKSEKTISLILNFEKGTYEDH